MSEHDERVWLKPGDAIAVVFDCHRCEDYRWRAVNPSRNIRRALKALDEGDIERARYFLEHAQEDADHLRQFAEDDTPASSTIDRPEGEDR